MLALKIVSPNKVVCKNVSPLLLSPYDVRIKVKSSAICGSDLNNINSPYNTPQIPGHEFSGQIVEMGQKAENSFSVGDMVTAFPMIGCLECEWCKKKDYRECISKKSIGFDLPGSFAEEILIDHRFVVPIDRDITYDQASLVEYFSCAYRLTLEICETQEIQKESPILIVGDGPIALANVQLLINFGFHNITLIGKHDYRMDYAKRTGVEKTIKYTEIHRLKHSNKFNVCIYSVRAETTLCSLISYMNSYAYLFLQARVSNLKLLGKLKEKKFNFGRAFSCKISDFVKVINLISDGNISTENTISEKISLDTAALLLSGNYTKEDRIKTVISP